MAQPGFLEVLLEKVGEGKYLSTLLSTPVQCKWFGQGRNEWDGFEGKPCSGKE